MLKYAIVIGVAFATIGSLPYASAQKTTELFIPIGKSPGLSGEYTKMGTIEEVIAQAQTIRMSDASGSDTIQVAEGTSIWLDKSKMKSTNQVGSFSDLVAGRIVEVKFKDNDPEGGVEWIKVQITGTCNL